LAEVARRIGVTQARIRRWFEEEKGHHTESSSSPESMGTFGSEPECCSRKPRGDEMLQLTRQLEEINERLEHVKGLLQRACTKIHQISMTLAAL
jgi:transposase-like protein